MSLFQKKEIRFMTDEELDDLETKIKGREREAELIKKQVDAENKIKYANKGSSLDIEKIKKYAIGVVIGIVVILVIVKILT